METSKTYENYPIWVVTPSILVTFSIYFLGVLITYRLGWVISIIYLGYILTMEYKLIRNDCINCYYWGKTCGFGRGRISSLFFKKGEPSNFCNNKISWKEMIPDLLVSLIPVIIGMVLLIIKFDLLLLITLFAIIAFATAGNGFIRGTLTCKYCRQRELGCPAERLFNKGK